MIRAGAWGYLGKTTELSRLAVAVQAVAHGDLYISASVANDLVRRAVQYNASYAAATLTTRELDVLRLLAQGYDNVEIASMLHVAPSTVKLHLAHIYDKLNLHSQAQLVAWAWRHGVVERG